MFCVCVCVRACVHARARVCASGMMGSRFVNGCFSHAKRGGQGPAEPSDRERERRCLGLSLKSRSSPGLFCLQSQQGPLGTDPFVLSVSLSLFLSLSLSFPLSLSFSLSLHVAHSPPLDKRLDVEDEVAGSKPKEVQSNPKPSQSKQLSVLCSIICGYICIRALFYDLLYLDICVSGLCFMISYSWIYVYQGHGL